MSSCDSSGLPNRAGLEKLHRQAEFISNIGTGPLLSYQNPDTGVVNTSIPGWELKFNTQLTNQEAEFDAARDSWDATFDAQFSYKYIKSFTDANAAREKITDATRLNAYSTGTAPNLKWYGLIQSTVIPTGGLDIPAAPDDNWVLVDAVSINLMRTDSASQLGYVYDRDYTAGMIILNDAMKNKLAIWYNGQFYSVGTDIGFTSNDFADDFTAGRFISAALVSKSNVKYRVGLISDIDTLTINVGDCVYPSGFFEDGDLVGHVGFVCKAGISTEITGRVYNTANGNHVVIDCDINSINVNWIGVNPSRTGTQNSTQLDSYLTEIGGLYWHSLFFHQHVDISELTINRDNVIIKTNLRSNIGGSGVNVFKPLARNFKLEGFRTKPDFNSRLIYCDTNAENVVNHEYRDIRINGATPATRNPFLYSTAAGGKGWTNISYSKVRGFTGAGATASLINMDHGANGGSAGVVCTQVFVSDMCRANGYKELIETTGGGSATVLEVSNAVSSNASGRGISTYHVNSGIVISGLEVRGHAESAYMWCGVGVGSSKAAPALIENSKFYECKDATTHPVTGELMGHGVIYEQLQRSTLSNNFYGANNGAGFVIGAGSFDPTISNQTSHQNVYGEIICSDAGGITDRIYDIEHSNCVYWGNAKDAVLLAGRLERISYNGGNLTGNCTSNSNWAAVKTGMSSIRFDKNHTEHKANPKETQPQLNKLSVVGGFLGKAIIGREGVNSYPEHSINIKAGVSTNVFVSSGCELNSLVSEIKTPVGITGSRLFVLSSLKASAASVPLYDIAGGTIKVINGVYDWSGNAVT